MRDLGGVATDLEDREIEQFVSRWFARRNSISFVDLIAEIHRCQRVVLTAIAAEFAPRLNDYLSAAPIDTLTDKQAIARWANAEVHHLGLSIKCPKTERHALLLVEKKSPTKGQFRHEILREDGKRIRTTSSSRMPSLVLEPAEPAIDGRGSWIKRTRNSSQANDGTIMAPERD